MKKKTILGLVVGILVASILGTGYLYLENTNVNNQNIAETTASNDNSLTKDAKTLVVYFSVPETDKPNNMTRDEDNSTVVVDGKVLGNTQYIAQLIKERTSADIFRLEPVNPYPTNHRELLKRAQDEMSSGTKVEINAKINNFDQYDTIYVGYPIWNADIPPIIETFLNEYKFDNKKVIPFCTHGGSGLAGTQNTIAQILPNANVIKNGFSISRTNMNNSIKEVDNWLKEINK